MYLHSCPVFKNGSDQMDRKERNAEKEHGYK